MGLEQQLQSLIQKIWVTKQLPPQTKVVLHDQAHEAAELSWPAFYEPVDEDAIFLARFAAFLSEQVPEDPEAFRFLLKFARECCLTRTSLINAYLYFARTRALLHYHWRLLFVNSLLIAERMYEDNYIHPAFIRQRYTSQPCASKFTGIQLEILTVLDWRVNTADEDFQRVFQAVCSRLEGPQDRAKLPQRPLPALPKISFEGFRRRSTASTAASLTSFVNQHAH